MTTMLSKSNFAGLGDATQIARLVGNDPRYYSRPIYPQRPLELNQSDSVLVGLLKRYQDGGRMNRDEEDQLALFGSWRVAFFQAELRCARNLQFLFRVMQRLESLSDIFAGWQLARLRKWVAKEYKLKKMPKVMSERIVNQWSEHLSYDMATMPKWLRDGSGAPTASKGRANVVPTFGGY